MMHFVSTLMLVLGTTALVLSATKSAKAESECTKYSESLVDDCAAVAMVKDTVESYVPCLREEMTRGKFVEGKDYQLIEDPKEGIVVIDCVQK